ncbi:MAG: hypothetical protein ACREER_00285 [Alphaproteobacteria bacterium]
MRFAAALLAVVMFAPLPASAASQLLVVLPTDMPIPFTCDDATCTVEVTTYCLQQDRPAPKSGDAYLLLGTSRPFAVVDAAGATVPLVAAPTITASRTYVSIRLTVPAAAVAGARGLVIGDGAILAPVAVPGDPNPQTDVDMALAPGLAVSVGARLVGEAPEIGVAIQVGRAANAFAAGTPEAELAAAAAAGAEAGAVIAACRSLAERGGADLHACLRGRHDGIVSDVNLRFWRALAAGS